MPREVDVNQFRRGDLREGNHRSDHASEFGNPGRIKKDPSLDTESAPSRDCYRGFRTDRRAGVPAVSRTRSTGDDFDLYRCTRAGVDRDCVPTTGVPSAANRWDHTEQDARRVN